MDVGDGSPLSGEKHAKEDHVQEDVEDGLLLGDDAQLLRRRGKEKHAKEKHAVKLARKKLPIRSSRRIQSRKDTVPIIVSSPTLSEESKMLRLTFQISNSCITITQRGAGRVLVIRRNVAKSRLDSGIEMEFISTRSNLMVDISEVLVNKILVDEASTATLNLFAIWMENTLPTDILEQVLFLDSMWSCMHEEVRDSFLQHFFSKFDLSKITLCFLPIIYRSHWSLFAYCGNNHKKALGLKGRKSYLLYFDSLGLTNPNECLDVLYSGLKCVTPYVADRNTQYALSNPGKELDLQIVEVSRQINGTDCGFYVMACVRYLIGGVLQGNKGKDWLTKNWFYYEDVCMLKMDLHEWCLQCLNQL